MGPIVIRLFEKTAPITVKNFVALARGGKPWFDSRARRTTTAPLYEGTIFHRVVPEFMIQGGDPLGTGQGDGGLTPIPDEFDPSLQFDVPGRVAMANAGPRTGTSQFFITAAPAPRLNGRNPIFGQVEEGMDIVEAITRVQTDAKGKPLVPVTIFRIAIKRAARPSL